MEGRARKPKRHNGGARKHARHSIRSSRHVAPTVAATPDDTKHTWRGRARHLAALLRASMDAVLIADRSGSVKIFNQAAERMFRCPAEEALGQPLARFLPGQAKESRAMAAVLIDEPTTINRVLRTVLARRADGEVFCAEAVLCWVDPAERDDCVVTLRDVSDRLRAEDSLHMLSRALGNTSDAVFVTDSDGVIKYVNPSFAELMAVTPEDAIGQRASAFKTDLHDEGFYKQLWETLQSGQVYRGVLVERARDGRLIHLEQTITPLRDDDGRITHFISNGRDVTSRVQTEAALRRLNEGLERQAKGIAQALHDEAGQLLTSAYIALANAKQELPPSSHDHLQVVKTRLDGIEEQLRRIAHELRPRILDDLGLVPALQFLADGITQRSGIAVSLESTLTSRLPALIETTIYRVAQEAFSNVRRHASADRVTIHLVHQFRQLRCMIVDNGVGFDTHATLIASQHDGMGLVSIRDRVEALGGTLDVRSAFGGGTQLIVTIPLED
jgi:two-component system, NarL family, sensor histidine kinase NreB